MAAERTKYPIRAEDYELYEIVGEGASAAVHRALCMPFNEIVAVKILDFERNNSDLNNICREAKTMILVDHPNVLKSHCSFVIDHHLWVVMPYMAGGSCFHIMKSAYPNGFEEAVIATVLREALKALDYLHQHGHIHRDLKAGNILIDARGGVKLGDFGVSASLYESGDRQRTRNTFVGTPCWMAPEVMQPEHGYDFKADIWSFGITALELAHGHAPFSSQPPMKVLLMTLHNAPPCLDSKRDKKFSRSFKHMIAMCLVKDPSKRPSAPKLLKHQFFKQAKSQDYIARKILEGLPSLGDRFKALKLKEEQLLAQKKMLDGEKEEMSQNEYKRGISAWNFDIEDLKFQASLIPEIEDAVPGKDPEGFSSCLSELNTLHETMPQGMPLSRGSSFKDYGDVATGIMMQNKEALHPSPDQSATFHRIRSNASENEHVATGSSDEDVLQNGLQSCGSGVESNLNRICVETTEKHVDCLPAQPCSERRMSTSSCASDILPSPKGERFRSYTQLHNITGNGGTFQTSTETPNEVISKASKAAVADDLNEKSKAPLVQQRGRFKVTSENVDLDKALPPLGIPKSHSFQVITQLPTSSVSSPFDATSDHLGPSLFLQLYNILQANILQRDNILSLMKEVSTGNALATPAEGTCIPASTPVTEKSLLEAAHEREKELMHDIADLQSRLISAQDELQRLKGKNAKA